MDPERHVRSQMIYEEFKKALQYSQINHKRLMEAGYYTKNPDKLTKWESMNEKALGLLIGNDWDLFTQNKENQ